VIGGRDHTLHVGVSVTPASEDDAAPEAAGAVRPIE
jgi:hypothetical protein